jgi:hypothetical protein
VLAALQVGGAGELSVLTLVTLSCVALGSLLAAAAGTRELVIAALLVAIFDLLLLRAGGIRIATAALLDARAGRMPDFAHPATTAFALAQYALSSDGDLLPATVPVAGDGGDRRAPAARARGRGAGHVVRYAN